MSDLIAATSPTESRPRATTVRRTTAIVVAALVGILAVLVPGAAAPAAPAPAGLIAFETPAGIHLINVDGTGLRRLPGTKPGDQNPRWSPKGDQIVFWTDARRAGEMYVVNADGSNRRLLTQDDPDSPSDQFPAWSPDGRLIAFESYRTGDWHIWVMDADGTRRPRRLTPNGSGGYSASWSPDSKRIVFTADGNWASLGIVNLARGISSVETLSINDFSPSWSPDGSQIAFTSAAQHEKGEINVVSPVGGKPERLTRNTAGDYDASWSPDGEHIVFDSGRAGLDEVYVMNADGTDQQRVTRIPTEYACCADWRPET